MSGNGKNRWDAADIPAKEPERQLYFVKKASGFVEEESRRLGRPLTAAVITFGCPFVNV